MLPRKCSRREAARRPASETSSTRACKTSCPRPLAKRKYSRPVHIATGSSVKSGLWMTAVTSGASKCPQSRCVHDRLLRRRRRRRRPFGPARRGLHEHRYRQHLQCRQHDRPGRRRSERRYDRLLVPGCRFEDGSGNIYVTNLYNYTNCDPYCYFSPGNVAYWTTTNQANGALPSGTYADPNMYEDYFGDVDNSGNVYLDGFRQLVRAGSRRNRPPLGSPSPSNLNISLEFPGGVYVVSPGGDGRAFGHRPGRVRIGLGCPLRLLAAGSEPAHHRQAEAEYREPLRPGCRRIQQHRVRHPHRRCRLPLG